MEDIYDLIIVGGGPAGITAGIYAVRHRLKSILITRNFGGQMNKKSVDIENYPGFPNISGAELIQKFEKHLKDAGEKIERSEVKAVKKKGDFFLVSTAKGKKFKAKAVIVASGADPRPLEVPGEKEYIGKGVSYCAVCDAPIFKDKDVAVVGGGNAAFETVIALSKWANKIYVLEASSKIGADEKNKTMVSQLKNVEITTDIVLKEIKGDKFLKSIIVEYSKTKERKTLNVEGVFVEIGHQPATSFVKDLVDFSPRDEIVIDPETCQTKTKGLFAAGDVTDNPFKQIVIAAGNGAEAAISAHKYLETTNE